MPAFRSPLTTNNPSVMPSSRESSPKFCADVMLGRLAKWLRIMGFDVLYSNSAEDEQLIAACKAQGRILLTRDTRLAQQARKSVRVVFTQGDHLREQLASIRREVPLAVSPGALFTRCVVCNTALVRAERDEVQGRVPAFVFNTMSEFRACPNCQKVYWRGSHVDHAMRTALESLPPETD